MFLVNRSLSKEIPATLTTTGGALPGAADVFVLSADKITAWNTFDRPDRVHPQTTTVKPRNGRLEISLPPYSVTRVSW